MPAKASRRSPLHDENALVDAVYSTIDRFEAWQEVLPQVARWLGSNHALLFTPNEGVSPRSFGVTHNIPLDGLRHYGEYYYARDVYKIEAERRGLVKAGVGFRSDHLVAPGEVKRTEIFGDLWRPLDILHMICYTLTDERDDALGPATVISLFRAPRKAPFSDEQVRRAEFLTPHLRRALTASRRLQSARTVLRAYEAGLQVTREVMLMVGPDLSVHHASGEPTELFGHGALFRLWRGKLIVNDAGVRRRLDMAMRDAAAGKPPEAIHAAFGTSLIVEITLVPLRAGQLLLRIRPIRRSPSQGVTQVAIRYRLTEAEQRVLALLAEGADVASIGRALAIRPMTVRKHLAHLFEKTATHAQRELVALVWQSA